MKKLISSVAALAIIATPAIAAQKTAASTKTVTTKSGNTKATTTVSTKGSTTTAKTTMTKAPAKGKKTAHHGDYVRRSDVALADREACLEAARDCESRQRLSRAACGNQRRSISPGD